MLNEVLILFGFTKLTYIVGIICMLMLFGCFLGGLLHGIILAHGGPIRPRPFFDQMSVRVMLVVEICMVVFALYYHGALIESVKTAHVIYWAFSLLSGPVLAFVGAQITGLIFFQKIADNEKAYTIWLKAQRRKKKEPLASKDGGSRHRSSRSFDPSAARGSS